MNIKILQLIGFCFIGFSCHKSDGVVLHPTDDFVSAVRVLENIISLADDESISKNIDVNSTKSTTHVIGNEKNSDKEYLPDIGEVTFDEYGHFYVSVNSLGVIKVFDNEGVFKFDLGGKGRGPGEFLMLTDVAYDKITNQLIALDRNEIEIFSVYKDTVIHKETIFTEITNATNICVLNNSFFINGYSIIDLGAREKNSFQSIQASKPIHQFDLKTGKYVRSFGENYHSKSNYGVFTGILSKTFIACDKTTETVIGILSMYPLITGYNPNNGSVKWKSGITEFNYRGYIENIKPVPTLKRRQKKNIYDDYFSLIDLDGKYMLLQIGYGLPDDTLFNLIPKLVNSGELSWRFIIVNTQNGKLKKLENNTSPNRILYVDRLRTVELKTPKMVENSPILLIKKAKQ